MTLILILDRFFTINITRYINSKTQLILTINAMILMVNHNLYNIMNLIVNITEF